MRWPSSTHYGLSAKSCSVLFFNRLMWIEWVYKIRSQLIWVISVNYWDIASLRKRQDCLGIHFTTTFATYNTIFSCIPILSDDQEKTSEKLTSNNYRLGLRWRFFWKENCEKKINKNRWNLQSNCNIRECMRNCRNLVEGFGQRDTQKTFQFG